MKGVPPKPLDVDSEARRLIGPRANFDGEAWLLHLRRLASLTGHSGNFKRIYERAAEMEEMRLIVEAQGKE